MSLLGSAVLELLKVEKPTLHSWSWNSWVGRFGVAPPSSAMRSPEHRALSRLGPGGRRVPTCSLLQP